jgi:hypothetical protein
MSDMMGTKDKDGIEVTKRKVLCCHGQAQRMTDERRQEIKRPCVFLERKSTRTSKEILHEGVQVTVNDREQTAGQWIESGKYCWTLKTRKVTGRETLSVFIDTLL